MLWKYSRQMAQTWKLAFPILRLTQQKLIQMTWTKSTLYLVSKPLDNVSSTNSNKSSSLMVFTWTIDTCPFWPTGCLWEDSSRQLTETESIESKMFPYYEKQVMNKLPIFCSELLCFLSVISLKVSLKKSSLDSLWKWEQTALKLWLMLTRWQITRLKVKLIKMKAIKKLNCHHMVTSLLTDPKDSMANRYIRVIRLRCRWAHHIPHMIRVDRLTEVE